MSHKFIVKSHTIKPRHDRPWRTNLLSQHTHKLRLRIALIHRLLRRNPRHHQRLGTRQRVIAQRDQHIIRLTNRPQIHIRPLPRKLHDPITARTQPRRLKVIEKECVLHRSIVAHYADKRYSHNTQQRSILSSRSSHETKPFIRLASTTRIPQPRHTAIKDSCDRTICAATRSILLMLHEARYCGSVEIIIA